MAAAILAFRSSRACASRAAFSSLLSGAPPAVVVGVLAEAREVAGLADRVVGARSGGGEANPGAGGEAAAANASPGRGDSGAELSAGERAGSATAANDPPPLTAAPSLANGDAGESSPRCPPRSVLPSSTSASKGERSAGGGRYDAAVFGRPSSSHGFGGGGEGAGERDGFGLAAAAAAGESGVTIAGGGRAGDSRGGCGWGGDGGGGVGPAASASNAASFPLLTIGLRPPTELESGDLIPPWAVVRGIDFFFCAEEGEESPASSSRSQLSVASMSIGSRREEFLLAAPRRREDPLPPASRPRAGFGRLAVADSRAAMGSAPPLGWAG